MFAGQLRLIVSFLLLAAGTILPVSRAAAIHTSDQVFLQEAAPHGGVATEAGSLSLYGYYASCS